MGKTHTFKDFGGTTDFCFGTRWLRWRMQLQFAALPWAERRAETGWPGSWQECRYLSISTCHSLRLLYPNLTSDLESEWHSIEPCSSLPCNLIISAGSLYHSKLHCSLAWGLPQCCLKLVCSYHCPHISSWFQHNAMPWGAWRKSQVSCMGIKEAGAERGVQNVLLYSRKPVSILRTCPAGSSFLATLHHLP